MPVRIEDGGKLGFGPWADIGLLIHDLSHPKKPRLLSHWQPQTYVPGAIPFHTIDVVRLDRGFVITNPEAAMPQCKESWHDSYIVDARDPANPQQIGVLLVSQ